MTKPFLKVAIIDVFDDNSEIKRPNMSKALRYYYDVELTTDNPDVVIASWADKTFLKYDCMRFFVGTEHFFPRTLFCDGAITNRHHHKTDILRHGELPWTNGFQEALQGEKNTLCIDKKFPKTEFCNFIFSNKNAKNRNDVLKTFFKHFGRENMHSWGRYENTIRSMEKNGKTITSDTEPNEIMAHYKFSICFENSSRYDSFSEKTMNALRARTVPIYWGGDAIYDYVKREAVIDARDFETYEKLAEYVEKVHKDDVLYAKYCLDNPFTETDVAKSQYYDILAKKLYDAIENQRGKKHIFRGIVLERIAFNILNKIYKRFWKWIMIKRRFFGGW